MPSKIRRKKKEEEATKQSFPTKISMVKIHQRFSSNINVRFVTMINKEGPTNVVCSNQSGNSEDSPMPPTQVSM